ncbi:S-methyl-5-thioribose-1-phosphate isomerase [Fodinibius sp. Rm-B-1B1-1]|uniref:S-methyl-5-thioribose-1-phosphate isomerase n=1 Tax=Fodinibius alkaliphilus TaxID=3140241 RepID=UPI00315A13AE
MNNDIDAAVQSIEWREDHVRILDQTYLPGREVYSDIRDVGRMWEAIKKLRIRGAPAIGIAAAYGMYLGIKELPENAFESFIVEVNRVAEYLEGAHPTATNLEWATNRIKSTIRAHKGKEISEIKKIVLQTAKTIHDEDKRICKKIGEHGGDLIPKDAQVLTHCNTGSLATGKYGTALSAIFHAHEQGKKPFVWVDETRPLLQGSRLTAWELMNAEIPMKIITDSAAGSLMQRDEVDMIIVGADRVAANGDVANQIGTYPLAVLAQENNVPFYVAAPLSTVDMDIDQGDDIPLVERDQEEILNYSDSQVAPKKAEAYNPTFDITPNSYITGIVTEEGTVEPPFDEGFRNIFED